MIRHSRYMTLEHGRQMSLHHVPYNTWPQNITTRSNTWHYISANTFHYHIRYMTLHHGRYMTLHYGRYMLYKDGRYMSVRPAWYITWQNSRFINYIMVDSCHYISSSWSIIVMIFWLIFSICDRLLKKT